MRDRLRVAGIVVLSVVFLGLMAHYSVAAPTHERTKQSVVTVQSSGDNVGETVYFWATVERNGEAVIVRTGGTRLSVVGTDTAAEPGDSIQIYGTIQSRGTVAAERIVVSERSRLWRLYVVSALALALAVAVFVRFWAIDARSLAFVPREGGDDA